MREEGGHHDLRLGREVQLGRARDDERFVDRSARNERGGREETEGFLEHGMHCVTYIQSVANGVRHIVNGN